MRIIFSLKLLGFISFCNFDRLDTEFDLFYRQFLLILLLYSQSLSMYLRYLHRSFYVPYHRSRPVLTETQVPEHSMTSLLISCH